MAVRNNLYLAKYFLNLDLNTKSKRFHIKMDKFIMDNGRQVLNSRLLNPPNQNHNFKV